MTMTRGRPLGGRSVRQRLGALAGSAALVLTAALAAAVPAAADEHAPPPDPWVTTNEEGYYTFTISQAEVEEIVGGVPEVVELQGNIGPSGTWADLAMDPSGSNYQGGWGPVEPGMYYYTYTATMPDQTQISFRNPATPVAVTSHPTWNTYFVPGPSVQWMSDVAGGGTVAELTYTSPVTSDEREALVWTPPGYDEARAEAYPVLYLLADDEQTHREWVELGRAPQILDNLAAGDEIEPMVVVMADVNVADPRTELLDGVVAATQADYHVSDEPAGQAVAGIGDGAGQALGTLPTGPTTAPADPFTDVTTEHPFYEAIEWMRNSGLTRGYDDGTFRSLADVNRDAMAAFLYRLTNGAEDAPACEVAPFTDVPVDHPFCGEIAWFKAQEITTGFPDGSFRPATPVSREAMAAFLFRMVNPETDLPECGVAPFADVSTGHPFCGAIQWMKTEGLSMGWPDGTFRPGIEIERQAMAAFLHRADLDVPDAPVTATFGSVGVFSGPALDDELSPAEAEAITDGTDLLRIYVGNVLDPAYNSTYELLQQLTDAGVEHQFDGVNPDSGGTWDSWRENLRDFASRAFADVADAGPSEGHLPLDEPYTPPAVGSITTPHIDENGIVTFETGTQWADASDVTVWGNWAPNGAWFRIPMEKVGDRWRLSVGPLDGFYYYRYVVDGVDEKDPADTVNTLTGVSPLYVPGETDQLLADAPEADQGDVAVLTYDSAVAGEERNAYVWTPPDYDAERAEAYPVFVLNHGGGQSYGDWVEVGRAPQILDNLYRQGEIEPMVVVMPNGNVPDYQAELRENVLPALSAEYHVSDAPADRAIAGLSMGAMNTFNTWLMHPGEFAYVAGFSGGLFAWPEEIDVAAVNAGTELALVYVGDSSDFAAGWVYGTMEGFDERGIEYEFAGVSVGPHGFDVWSLNLIDLLPRLFASDTDPTG